MPRSARTLAALVAGLLLAGRPAGAQGPAGVPVDLTHGFGESTVYWPTAEGFRLSRDTAGITPGGFWYAASSFCSAEHGGTHLDAPVHFGEGRRTVDQIPLEDLIGDAVVVDVSAAAAEDPDYRVDLAVLHAWEKAHGRIPDRAMVLLQTGWDARWPDAARYLGTAERGAGAVADLHFPGLHPEAAAWLVAERRVKAVGIDTASIDHGPSREFAAHRLLAAADVPVFENVAHLDRLPPRGAWVIALPIKIEGGTGGPLRIVAFVPPPGDE